MREIRFYGEAHGGRTPLSLLFSTTYVILTGKHMSFTERHTVPMTSLESTSGFKSVIWREQQNLPLNLMVLWFLEFLVLVWIGYGPQKAPACV